MPAGDPSGTTVVRTAADAAEGVILDRYKQSEIRDFDVTISYDEGVLEVDVYLNVPEEVGPGAEAVAEEAARTAREAVDDLFEAQ